MYVIKPKISIELPKKQKKKKLGKIFLREVIRLTYH